MKSAEDYLKARCEQVKPKPFLFATDPDRRPTNTALNLSTQTIYTIGEQTIEVEGTAFNRQQQCKSNDQ